MANESYRFSKRPRKIFSRNGIIIMSVVLVAAVAAAAVFLYVHYSPSFAKQAYINNWSALAAYGNSAASAQSPAVTGEVTNVEGRNDPIVQRTRIDPNVENILVLGIDKGDNKTTTDHRSDCIIVASLNSKTHKAKLVSIMRDIRAYFPADKIMSKINAAYQDGGPGNTVNVINYDFGLDIQKYVVIDFHNFKKIVDAAGGVKLKITAKEAGQIRGLTTKKAGTYLLNGAEALDYSRIRHIDSDFFRVQRQRKVMMKIFYKYRDMNIALKSAFVSRCLPFIKTNMTTSDVLYKALTQGAKVKGKVTQLTVPTAGMYTQVFRPAFYFKLNWAGEKKALLNYLYSPDSSDSSSAATSSGSSSAASSAS